MSEANGNDERSEEVTTMDYEDKIEALKLVEALEIKFIFTHNEKGAHGRSTYSLIPSTTDSIVQGTEEQEYIDAFFERFIDRALETLLYELEMPALNEPDNEEHPRSKILTEYQFKKLIFDGVQQKLRESNDDEVA